jgi:transcriptional regulator with XRE-family HTH domain
MLARMDEMRVGSVLRAIRRRMGLSQAVLAGRAAVSQATVSRCERGELEQLSVATVRRVLSAAEIRLDLVPRWRGADLARLVDEAHAGMVERVNRLLATADWEALAEVTFSVYGERGSLDVLGWHRASRSVLVVEVKSRLVDLQDTLAALDRKVRLAPQLAAERGWGGSPVSAWLVVRDSRTNRRVLAAHRLTLRTALPTDGRSVAGWLRRPVGTVRALSFLPDSPPRNR